MAIPYSQLMNPTRALGAGALVLALATFSTGCTTAPEEPAAVSTPEEAAAVEPDPNQEACDEFEQAFLDAIQTLTDKDAMVKDWDDTADDFDVIALRAEGDVKDRMMNVVDNWPDYADIVLFGEFEVVDDIMQPVSRACDAAGYPIPKVFSLVEIAEKSTDEPEE